MAFVPAASLQDLPEEGFKALVVEGRAILVGRIQRRLFACLDRCPHSGAPLRIGKRRGEELTCAWHGWTFNLVSGEAIPAQPSLKLTQFPVKVDGDQVLVDLPETAPTPS